MAKKNEKEVKQVDEQVDILDLLLDEDNYSPITLYDDEDKEVSFEQIAIIPDEDKLYVILKPIDELDGIADDEAIVFAVEFDEDGSSMLVVEENEEIAIRVFDKYHQLLDEEEAKDKETKKPAKKPSKK